MKLIWCNGIPKDLLSIVVVSGCILSICTFSDMWKLFGVMVFHRSIVNCSFRGRCVLSICVFCYSWNLFGVPVFNTPFVNWTVEGRCILSICVICYMWKLFGVMVFHRYLVNWSFWVRCILSICALSDMWNLFGVKVFQRSIVIEVGGWMYPQYIYILWHVKLIWCNGIPLTYCQLEWWVDVSSVYVYSAICETYLV